MLLQGFVVQDNGREGERVTPTGAAILKHLAPSYRPPAQAMIMGRSGIGFGARHFEGIPNILRLIALEPVAGPQTDEVAVLQFEVDDQPAEDLALGLEKLRNLPAVIDVIQLPAFGKQGRLTSQIQLLADRGAGRCNNAMFSGDEHAGTALAARAALGTGAGNGGVR